MLKFRRPVIGDRETVLNCVESSGKQGDECAFANIFLFRERYDIEICFYEGFFLQTYWSSGENCGYNFPVGKGNLSACLDAMLEDARERGRIPRIWLMSQEESELLCRLYPGRFVVESARDDFDYIYNRDDLALLSGKKYQSKRNHISRFIRDYPSWRYEELSPANFEDAEAVARRWHEECGKSNVDISVEINALSEAKRYFGQLGLSGGLLYAHGVPVAMTVASRIREGVVDVHYEKALSEYNGAYALINREFALRCNAELINREEDVGDEGLRYAKLSYHPAILLEKFNAEPDSPRILRPAGEADIPALKQLWHICFDDTPDEARLFFDRAFYLSRGYVSTAGGVITSMLFLFPCSIAGIKAHYLYGACTHPEHRDRGLMSDLLRFALRQAECDGDELSLLLPADARLYRFYANSGYLPLYGTRTRKFGRDELRRLVEDDSISTDRHPDAVQQDGISSRKDNSANDAIPGSNTCENDSVVSAHVSAGCTTVDFPRLESTEKSVPAGAAEKIIWSDEYLSYAASLSSLGGKNVGAGGCLLSFSDESCTQAYAAFLSHCSNGEKASVSALLDATPATEITLRFPAESSFSDGQSEPFGMYLPLTPRARKVAEKGIFLSPALD